MPINYTYSVDLRCQDTTPSFVVSYVDPNSGGTHNYPANNMPHLVKGDTLTFQYLTDPAPKQTMVTEAKLYVRALVNGEFNSPFSAAIGPDGDADYIYDVLVPNQKLTVVRTNGHWSFSIAGMISVPSLPNPYGTIVIPFYIDPDMDVGTGIPP